MKPHLTVFRSLLESGIYNPLYSMVYTVFNLSWTEDYLAIRSLFDQGFTYSFYLDQGLYNPFVLEIKLTKLNKGFNGPSFSVRLIGRKAKEPFGLKWTEG